MDTKNNLNKYGIIYRITNNVNGKIYIGQTIRPIKERFWEHKKINAVDTYLRRGIKKYGKQNFKIIEIDSAESQDELNYLEKYWIKFYNSQNKNIGYNIMDGGDAEHLSRQRRLERAKFFIKNEDTGEIFISCLDASKYTGITAGNIYLCYSNKTRSAGGFVWKKINRIDIKDYSTIIYCDTRREKAPKLNRKFLLARWGIKDVKHLYKKVKCLETNQTWGCVKDAANFIGISSSYLCNILRGRKSSKSLNKTFIYID